MNPREPVEPPHDPALDETVPELAPVVGPSPSQDLMQIILVVDPRTMLADTDPVALLTQLLADAHIRLAHKVAHIPGIFGEA